MHNFKNMIAEPSKINCDTARSEPENMGIHRGDNSAKENTPSKMNQLEIEGCLIMEHQPLLRFISVQSQKSETRGFLSFLLLSPPFL